MRKTEYYNLDVLEGSDKANIPISQAPNITAIDEQMHTNASNGFSPATEQLNGMVHNLTRQVPDAGMIRWIATAPYAAGDTFTVDGVSVTARTVSGENLPSGAYIIGQCVQAFVDGANMTVFVDSGNAQLFNNKTPDYFQRSLTKTSIETIASNVSFNGSRQGVYIGALPPDHSTISPLVRIVPQDDTYTGKILTFLSGVITIDLNRNYMDTIFPANAELTVYYRVSNKDRFTSVIAKVYQSYKEYKIIFGAMPGEYILLASSLPNPMAFNCSMIKNYNRLVTMIQTRHNDTD